MLKRTRAASRPASAGVSELGIDNAIAQTALVRELAAIRRKRGLTLDEVAVRMHMPVDTVAHFELGGMDFAMSFVRKYAKVVGARLQMHASLVDEDQR